MQNVSGVAIVSNFAQICTWASLHVNEKFEFLNFWYFENWQIHTNFTQKKRQKHQFSPFFATKIAINKLFFKFKFQNFKLLAYMVGCSGANFSKIGQKLQPLIRFVKNILNFRFSVFFYNRSYQSGELQNVITSRRGWIMTFRKSMFPFVEIFQISSTWFFWPWPPPIALRD